MVTCTELSQGNVTGKDCSVQGAAPPGRQESLTVGPAAVSGLCHDSSKENNWHLLSKFLAHLLLVKNASAVLRGAKARAKESSLLSSPTEYLLAAKWERCQHHICVQAALELELPLAPPHRLARRHGCALQACAPQSLTQDRHLEGKTGQDPPSLRENKRKPAKAPKSQKREVLVQQ